jgi:hypothetical protein
MASPHTGIDSSAAAIQRAKQPRAGVSVNFQVADASRLEGEPSTYQVNMSMTAFETMLACNPDKFEEIKLAALRFKLIESSLPNGRAHAPVWGMHATRID